MNKCRFTDREFEISQSLLDHLEKVSPVINGKTYLISPPTLHPDERMRRRTVFRNEVTLYRRKCDKTGVNIISLFSEDKPYKVYSPDAWWSDDWDPLSYGMDYDFSRPFFEQFDELLRKTPLICLWNTQNENAEYNNNCFSLKDSYMNFNTDYGERNFYSYMCDHCNDIAECTMTHKAELSYDVMESLQVYRCFFSKTLNNSSYCYFCTDLRNCSYCIGCHGLRGKKYCAFNEQLTQEDWEQKYANPNFTHTFVEEMQKKSYEVYLKVPKRCVLVVNSENCTGDRLYNCKNCHDCYDVVDGEELERVIYAPFNTKYVQDAYAVGGMELCYDLVGGGVSCYHCAFLVNPLNGPVNSYYCYQCINNTDSCFGCVSLKKKKYCILNKQYTKEEYEELLPRIIEHMKSTGEWGEFFPANISPFCYNETMAHEMFPLTKEEVLNRGLKWRDTEEKPYLGEVYKVPDSIEEVSDEVINKTLICAKTGKPYKITPNELILYRKLGVALPKIAPLQRHIDVVEKRAPRKLYDRVCAKTGVSIKSSYAPDRPEIVYSHEVYVQEFNT